MHYRVLSLIKKKQQRVWTEGNSLNKLQSMCYKCIVVRKDIYVNDHDRLTLNLRLGNGLI
jgi:uncharacterized surface protein with fasciclin (FAS1) repeats